MLSFHINAQVQRAVITHSSAASSLCFLPAFLLAHFTFMWSCIVTNFFIIKPTWCTNFPNLLWHETLHVLGSSSAHHQEFIHCMLGTGICETGLKTAFEQDWFHPGPAWKLSSNLYDNTSAERTVNKLLMMGRGTPRNIQFHAGVNLGNWWIWLVLL